MVADSYAQHKLSQDYSVFGYVGPLEEKILCGVMWFYVTR